MRANEIIKEDFITSCVKKNGRRSGRTTLMVAHAVETAQHELVTILVAHANHVKDIRSIVDRFSEIACVPATNITVQSYDFCIPNRGKVFVDHNVYELLIEKISIVFHKDSYPQCSDIDYVKDCLNGLMEELG